MITGRWQQPGNIISGLLSSAQTLLQKNLLEACSHGVGTRLHPQKIIKITTAIFLVCKINAWCSTSSAYSWKILHCYYVWRVFFQMSYWHVTTPIFRTCRWTFIKQRRKLTFLLIRGNWIWFFIPSKHLFTDRINPINCFNPCICLESILYAVVTKHVIKVNEDNYQWVQIWGFWILFSDVSYVTILPYGYI